MVPDDADTCSTWRSVDGTEYSFCLALSTHTHMYTVEHMCVFMTIFTHTDIDQVIYTQIHIHVHIYIQL